MDKPIQPIQTNMPHRGRCGKRGCRHTGKPVHLAVESDTRGDYTGLGVYLCREHWNECANLVNEWLGRPAPSIYLPLTPTPPQEQ